MGPRAVDPLIIRGHKAGKIGGRLSRCFDQWVVALSESAPDSSFLRVKVGHREDALILVIDSPMLIAHTYIFFVPCSP
jgi:hypothetical protein